jgi:succinate-semialdehyde dehydrogenase/glutarate-semialdehyde dehydrogenase
MTDEIAASVEQQRGLETSPDRSRERPVFTVINPASGLRGRTYRGHLPCEVGPIAAAARKAFQSWRRTTFDQRATLMRAAAAVLDRRREEFASLMAEETGKPVAIGRAEIDKCIFQLQAFCERSRGLPRSSTGCDQGCRRVHHL